jgi:aerobic-type carbon monoxide dehydrogenase small subunit (CoxS/CutS family)
MRDTIRFTLNGKPVTLETDGDRTLLVEGQPVRSCTTDLNAVQGKRVTTIEGLAGNGRLHPLQQAFSEQGGFQCGYCTPGMIMNAYALLLDNPKPTRDDIIQGMEKNLCRCSAYNRIIEAIEVASGQMGGGHG